MTIKQKKFYVKISFIMINQKEKQKVIENIDNEKFTNRGFYRNKYFILLLAL